MLKRILGVAAAMAIIAVGAIAGPGTAVASASAEPIGTMADCTFTDYWSVTFRTAPVHTKLYGHTKVVGYIIGTSDVDGYCCNSYGNLWWILVEGYVYDGYRTGGPYY